MPSQDKTTHQDSYPSQQVARLERELTELRCQVATLPASASDPLVKDETGFVHSEARYRALLELSPQVVWMTDPEGNNTYANRYWHEFSGMTAEQTTKYGWLIALHPDDVRRVQTSWSQALATGGIYEEEMRLRRSSDGRYRWHFCRSVPLRDAHGQIVQWLGVSVDVHDRKVAAEAIAQANERTRLALEAADIGTWDYFPASEAIECSSRCLEIFQTNGKPTREGFLSAIHPDDRDRVVQMLRQALNPEIAGTYDIEYRIVRPDGSVRWIFAKGKSFFSGEGRTRVPVRFSGMLIDVTERRATERDRASLAAALQNSPDFIGITDVRGRVLFLNRAGQELVGLRSDEEARTKTAFDFLGPAERSVVEHEMLPMVREGKVWEYELTMRHMITGQPLLVETRVFGIFDERGRLTRMVNLSRDISEKRRLDEQMRVAQKMEAVGRLAGGIAHDFNNLLTIIRGATEMLQERNQRAGDAAILKEVADAAERASALTDQLLAFGRQRMVRPQPISLNRAVLAIQDMLQRLAGEDVSLRIQLDEHLHNVKMDPVEIDQILINLVANARDAMPHGGEIKIQTSNQQPHAGPDDTKSDEYVCLSLSDTGQGMPPGALSHIFEPFFTTKHDGRNSGLGLATVYGIVQQGNGHIEVRSARGHGTSFAVYLPRTTEEIAADPVTQPSTTVAEVGNILLVEDETSLRNVLGAYLRELGYQVYEADDALEATAVAQNQRIDLLLTDIVMPGISGAGLCSALSESQPEMRVIFMSGYADHAELQAALRRKNAIFVQKPFRFSELLPKIRQALAGQVSAPEKEAMNPAP